MKSHWNNIIINFNGPLSIFHIGNFKTKYPLDLTTSQPILTVFMKNKKNEWVNGSKKQPSCFALRRQWQLPSREGVPSHPNAKVSLLTFVCRLPFLIRQTSIVVSLLSLFNSLVYTTRHDMKAKVTLTHYAATQRPKCHLPIVGFPLYTKSQKFEI